MTMVAVVVGAAALLAPTDADAFTACGKVSRFTPTSPVINLVDVRARGVGCRAARGVVADPARRVAGNWRCRGNRQGIRCIRLGGDIRIRRANQNRCGRVAFQRQTGNGAFSIRGHRTPCRAARAVARASGSQRGLRFRVRGFRCVGVQERTDALPRSVFTCVRGSLRGGRTVGFSV